MSIAMESAAGRPFGRARASVGRSPLLLAAGPLLAVLTLASLTLAGVTLAAGPARAEPVQSARSEDGKYFDADDAPVYNIKDGNVDWYTYSGYRRYHSECHVCHGPDGEGSTYAPALAKSLQTMKYPDFVEVVIQGRQNVGAGRESVMPAFGLNKNVVCYLDDIYVYLRARADGVWGRGRPDKHDDKSESAKEAEKACIGG